MNAEALLAAGYAFLLTAGAWALEWLSAHTHRRALSWRTAGFRYDEQHDHWLCPEGQHLWPHEFDHERRLVRYRAKAHICNGCPRKPGCTDSDEGREVVRPVDPGHTRRPAASARISLMLIALALLVVVVGIVRNHDPAEIGVLGAVLVACILAGRWLLRDFRAHPAGFPPPAPSHGLRLGAGTVIYALAAVGVLVIGLLLASIRVLREYEQAILFRLGRLLPVKGPGLVLLLPAIDRMVRVDLRTVALTIAPQEVITRDNVPARVAAVCYFRVVDPSAAVTEIEAFEPATSQIAQTTLRSVLGRADLDQLLAERERFDEDLQKIIDEQTESWGIKVMIVEIKDVEIPEAMQRAMARQAEAERERRAKIINAEGEFQAAEKLAAAARSVNIQPRCSCDTCKRCSRWGPTTTPRSCSRSPSTCSSRSWTASVTGARHRRPGAPGATRGSVLVPARG